MNYEYFPIQLANPGQKSPIKDKDKLVETIVKNGGTPMFMLNGTVCLLEEHYYAVTDNIGKSIAESKIAGKDISDQFVIRRVVHSK